MLLNGDLLEKITMTKGVQETYRVQEGGESIEARLIDPKIVPRKVEINYTRDGETCSYLFVMGGCYPKENARGDEEHLGGLRRLIPKLRDEIPEKYHSAFGSWLGSSAV